MNGICVLHLNCCGEPNESTLMCASLTCVGGELWRKKERESERERYIEREGKEKEELVAKGQGKI